MLFVFSSAILRAKLVSRFSAMNQLALQEAWLAAPAGNLCPWQQARALALRDASRELHDGRAQLQWIADRVEKATTSPK